MPRATPGNSPRASTAKFSLPQRERGFARSAPTRRYRHWRRGYRRRHIRAPRPSNAARHCVFVGHVGDSRAHAIVAWRIWRAPRRSPQAVRASRSASTTQAPSASRRAAVAEPMPPAPPVISAMRPSSDFGLGHALQLGFFQRPVFDAERFLLRQSDIAADRFGAAHDVDGVARRTPAEMRAVVLSLASVNIPTCGTSITTGLASRMAGESAWRQRA